jgi:hypothetical protein
MQKIFMQNKMSQHVVLNTFSWEKVEFSCALSPWDTSCVLVAVYIEGIEL